MIYSISPWKAAKGHIMPVLCQVNNTWLEPTYYIYPCINPYQFIFQLGVEGAFSEGGFGGIIPDVPLKVSSVKHRATIEVTKTGTVGAAATALELVALSGQVGITEQILIDRPFLFFVRDLQLHAIVFAGKVTNPLE